MSWPRLGDLLDYERENLFSSSNAYFVRQKGALKGISISYRNLIRDQKALENYHGLDDGP